MNLKEFAALKVGDKIENPTTGGMGTVSAVADAGVKVQWGVSALEFFYSVNTTAWMHWRKVEGE